MVNLSLNTSVVEDTSQEEKIEHLKPRKKNREAPKQTEEWSQKRKRTSELWKNILGKAKDNRRVVTEKKNRTS